MNELIDLAKSSIECVFSGKEVSVDNKVKEKFSEKQGVFVTLTIEDKLRGCIGYVEPVFPLFEAVIRAGKAAAFSDPRFPRLQKQEFKHVKIEISVLTIPELIKVENKKDFDKIEIGKQGLIIRGPRGSGLLLPQVFSDHNCSVLEALKMTCQKAGLASDAWREQENKIYRFEVEIVDE
ncbi:MAG: hypothetical protein MAG795_00461 [Candidatus Woesearchaeota archaeon]|nr:hypothetical protein [Candidatus Woesearchaeota archaeon]